MRLTLTWFRQLYNIYVPSFVFRNPLSFLGVMASNMPNQIDELIWRLNEAERRAKILNHEVKSIRQEILVLKNNVTTIPSTSAGVSTPSTSSVTRRKSRATRSSVDDADGVQHVNKKNKLSFNEENGFVVVYTDGACENNGKSNAKAGIGVWFGDNHPLNISKPLVGKATNNNAEIQACVEALNLLLERGVDKVHIYTDSQFTISCITKWIKNWKKNNWRTANKEPVKNKDELQKLDAVIQQFDEVTWTHVAGHRGVKGNEEADKLARQGALLYRPS